MRRSSTIPVVFATAVFVLAACDQAINPIIGSLGGNTASGGDSGAVALTITPPSAQLTVPQTVQLSTTAPDSLTPIVWTSSDPSVATVSSTGLVTAIGSGTTTVTARSSVDTNATGSALITVSM